MSMACIWEKCAASVWKWFSSIRRTLKGRGRNMAICINHGIEIIHHPSQVNIPIKQIWQKSWGTWWFMMDHHWSQFFSSRILPATIGCWILRRHIFVISRQFMDGVAGTSVVGESTAGTAAVGRCRTARSTTEVCAGWQIQALVHDNWQQVRILWSMVISMSTKRLVLMRLICTLGKPIGPKRYGENTCLRWPLTMP